MSADFVAGEGHRWWLDSRKCNHTNENVCAGCDFDRYYAKTYKSCPWGKNEADLFEVLDQMTEGDGDD